MSETNPETKKPYIIQFESEDFYRAVAGLILFDLGMEVAKTARDLKQADILCRQIEDKKITPDIAIIDTLIEREHSEGEMIAQRLKAACPNIKLIAYTIIEEQPWADYSAAKSNRDPERTLIKGLEQLTGAKPQEKVKSSN